MLKSTSKISRKFSGGLDIKTFKDNIHITFSNKRINREFYIKVDNKSGMYISIRDMIFLRGMLNEVAFKNFLLETADEYRDRQIHKGLRTFSYTGMEDD